MGGPGTTAPPLAMALRLRAMKDRFESGTVHESAHSCTVNTL